MRSDDAQLQPRPALVLVVDALPGGYVCGDPLPAGVQVAVPARERAARHLKPQSVAAAKHVAGRPKVDRPTVRVYGALALNAHVGGLNPAAVAAALATGARVIWMPTADCHTQEAAGLPRLCRTQPWVTATTYAIPPVDPTTADSVRRTVALVAEADAVLATGHLSTPEIAWLLPVARAAGVTRVLLTHPSWTVPAMSAADAAALADGGAYAEITAYQLRFTRVSAQARFHCRRSRRRETRSVATAHARAGSPTASWR
jgi:hypothetical protein